MDEPWFGPIEKRRRRALLIATAAGVVTLVAAGALAVALVLHAGGSRVRGGVPAAGSAAATNGASAAASAGAATASSSPASTSLGASATASAALPRAARRIVRAALVAYRAAGAVWICAEDGSRPRRVVASTAGPFALSPDGTRLALVDERSRTLTVVETASGTAHVVGPALLDRPVWAPDSSFVVYDAQEGGGQDVVVRRADRDGATRTTLGPGSAPSVSASGVIVAVAADSTGADVRVAVLSAGRERHIGHGIVANAVAVFGGLVAYCDAGSTGVAGPARTPRLGLVGLDGRGARTLVRSSAAGAGTFFGEVAFTLDGKSLVFTESGDDGYSRIYCVAVTGGDPLRLSTRRDAYPVGLSADGKRLLYIDGNALQGEPTRLMSVRLDGRKRTVLREDAGL